MDSDSEREQTARRSKSIAGLLFAFASGVLGCLAGTFGKLAMTKDETLFLCENSCTMLLSTTIEAANSTCLNVALYFQILFFLLMILINGLMWITFVKALHFCGTSLEATVVNTAANFFSSALVGKLLFGESASLMWWCGTLLILFGLILMNYDQKGGNNKFGSAFINNKAKKKKLS